MNDLVDKIKENTDIVDVIGRYVSLKRVGNNFKGLCPFHNEKTPSFSVSPVNQYYKCFGCGKSGDIINFIQEIENLDFMETVEKLAEESGVEINFEFHKEDKKKDEMYEVSRQAAIHFYKNLRNGSNDGLKYVVSRGISPETAQKFGIGYAKAGWNDLHDYFCSRKISEELALETGLLSRNRSNKIYDKFRNRVIFPIRNTRGKVIGFGGRSIDGQEPKYLNSPESDIFKKKDNLYGLDMAKNSIRKNNLAIMVEGYMDVVSLVAAGIENVVATLGTALTPDQARLLKRYTDTVVLSYDSDNAGKNAAFRGIDILQDAGLKVKILRIDDGKDPDEYIRKNGKKAFDELVINAVSGMEFKIDCIKVKHDMNTTDGSIGFLEEISRELIKINSPIQQAAYIRQVSKLSGIPESSIKREIDISQTGNRNISRNNKEQVRGDLNREKDLHFEMIQKYKIPVARQLVRLMLDCGRFVPVIAENDEISGYFYGSGYERIFEQIVSNYRDDSEVEIDVISDSLEERDIPRFRDIVENMFPAIEEEKTLIDCARIIRLQKLSSLKRDILKKMAIMDENNEGDNTEIAKLTNDMMKIDDEIKKLREGKE